MPRAFEAEKVAVLIRVGFRRLYLFPSLQQRKGVKKRCRRAKSYGGGVSYLTSQTARTDEKNRKNRPET